MFTMILALLIIAFSGGVFVQYRYTWIDAILSFWESVKRGEQFNLLWMISWIGLLAAGIALIILSQVLHWSGLFTGLGIAVILIGLGVWFIGGLAAGGM